MTAAKKTAPKKTSPKKVDAAESEAKDERTYFSHAGVDYIVPPPLKFPLELLETDDEIEAVKLILGDEQWATYRATKPTIGDFYELAQAMADARGEDSDSGN